MPQAVRVEYIAGASTDVIRYVGYANPGTSTAEPFWRIARITSDASDNPVTVEWADGNEAYDNIWDNRAVLVYS